MKKFQVENAYRNADMIAAGEYSNITFDFVGDYIEANTAERYSEWYQANKERINEYQRKRSQNKLNAMTPEELAVYREKINARARDNYRKRKEKNKESDQ